MKKTHIILLALIVVAIGGIFAMVGDFSSYETFASARAIPTSEFHVVGVLDKSQKEEFDAVKDPNHFAFYMKDKNNESCRVVFNSTRPQDFERSEQIVLTGKWQDKEFRASNILLKCPSKYTNKEAEEQEFKSKS